MLCFTNQVNMPVAPFIFFKHMISVPWETERLWYDNLSNIWTTGIAYLEMFFTYIIHVNVMTLAFELHSIFTVSSGYMIQLLQPANVYFLLLVVLDAPLMLLSVFFIDSIAVYYFMIYDEFVNFQPLFLVPCFQINFINYCISVAWTRGFIANIRK